MVAIKSEASPFLICNRNEANYLLVHKWHLLQVSRMKGLMIKRQEGQDDELSESNKISQEIQIYMAGTYVNVWFRKRSSISSWIVLTFQLTVSSTQQNSMALNTGFGV